MNQECVAISQCTFTKYLNMLMKLSSNEDEKKGIQQLINSRTCGDASGESVCCDMTQGKSSLLYCMFLWEYTCALKIYLLEEGKFSN